MALEGGYNGKIRGVFGSYSVFSTGKHRRLTLDTVNLQMLKILFHTGEVSYIIGAVRVLGEY